jgi:hypothetical protein
LRPFDDDAIVVAAIATHVGPGVRLTDARVHDSLHSSVCGDGSPPFHVGFQSLELFSSASLDEHRKKRPLPGTAGLKVAAE